MPDAASQAEQLLAPAAPRTPAVRQGAVGHAAIHPLESMIGQEVVLDTAGPILYLGTLAQVLVNGYWLERADVHDCREGHADKELYVCESKLNGIRPNRRHVFVAREAVISLSCMADIIID